MTEPTDALSPTLATDAAHLARALRGVRSEADEALTRMAAGGRPGSSMTGALLPSAREVEHYAGRVELLVNWAGSPLMPHDKAEAALRATAPTPSGMHNLRLTGEDVARLCRALDFHGADLMDAADVTDDVMWSESDAVRSLRERLTESLANPPA